MVGSSKIVLLTFLTLGILLARRITATALCVSYRLAGFPRLLPMAIVGFLQLQESGSSNAQAYCESDCTIYAIVPLARVSHMANPRPTKGGDYPRTYIEMEESVAILIIYPSILCQIIYTVWYIIIYPLS